VLSILFVENNAVSLKETFEALQTAGHRVRSVAMAEEITDAVGAFVPDIYVIGLSLQHDDGLILARRVRSTQPLAGIVIVTARSRSGDRVEGYESGADLYLTQPVHPGELRASIAALGNRLRLTLSTNAKRLQVHKNKMQLIGPKASADLIAGEQAILSALAIAPGRTLERWQLMEILGTGDESPSTSALEMRIARLRKKLVRVGAESPTIKSLHKVGYTLCKDVVLV